LQTLQTPSAKDSAQAKTQVATVKKADNTTTKQATKTALVKPTTSLPDANIAPKKQSDIIKILEIGVGNGDIIATYQLALMYLSGKNVQQDLTQAAELMQNAAQNNYPAAQNDLANMYMRGMGVAKDYRKSYYWALKALENNYQGAKTTLFYLQKLNAKN
jgi:TPR repeat protein